MQDACTAGDLTRLQSLLNDLKHSQRNEVLADMADAAVTAGQAAVLKFCLEQGAQLTWRLASWACTKGDISVYKVLMDAGLDVNEDFHHSGDAIIKATQANRFDLAKFLLENGAELDTDRMWSYHMGPLAVAAWWSEVEILSLLIERGAPIPNSLALHYAASRGRIDIIRCLLDAGADINELATPDNSSTGRLGPPIHYAAMARHLEAVEFLLNRGADARLLDLEGRNVIDRSSENGAPWLALLKVIKSRNITFA